MTWLQRTLEGANAWNVSRGKWRLVPDETFFGWNTVGVWQTKLAAQLFFSGQVTDSLI